MEGNTPTPQDRPVIRGPDDFWAAYAGIPEAAAAGLIRGLPELLGQEKGLSVSEALDILIKIGQELNGFETCLELRAAARLVLARHLAPLVSENFPEQMSAIMALPPPNTDNAKKLLSFYAADDFNLHLTAKRDTEAIRHFLRCSYYYYLGYHNCPEHRDYASYYHEERQVLLQAILRTASYGILSTAQHPLFSALPQLYGFLTQERKGVAPLCWGGWSSWPAYAVTTRALEQYLTTARKTAIRKSHQTMMEDVFRIWQACNWAERWDNYVRPQDPSQAVQTTRTLLTKFDRICQYYLL